GGASSGGLRPGRLLRRLGRRWRRGRGGGRVPAAAHPGLGRRDLHRRSRHDGGAPEAGARPPSAGVDPGRGPTARLRPDPPRLRPPPPRRPPALPQRGLPDLDVPLLPGGVMPGSVPPGNRPQIGAWRSNSSTRAFGARARQASVTSSASSSTASSSFAITPPQRGEARVPPRTRASRFGRPLRSSASPGPPLDEDPIVYQETADD